MSATIPEPTPTRTADQSGKTIVFFDGECGFCSASVDFWMHRDTADRLQYASLQGETAAQLLPEAILKDLNTMVVQTEDGHQHTRTAAIVRILWRLGGLWPLVGTLLWIVPAPLRDLAYRGVARMRYHLMGRRETCRIPTPAEAGRILP